MSSAIPPLADSLQTEQLSTDVTVTFVLASAYLVFFMHCGFAMISVGCVRARFAKHIAILILMDACASAMGYYLFGYAFAWGDHTEGDSDNNTLVYTQNAFIGSKFFALHGLDHGQFFLWVFQWSFAATACTIVSGAIAERAKFETYILYSFFMAAWVYPVLTHSIWSPAGWAGMFRGNGGGRSYLAGVGAIDFAGSGAVHMVGGLAALTGCAIIGPRIGRFLPDGTVVDMPGHNTSLFVLGVMILWFGWYGFNPGSQLGVYSYGDAIANAAVTTTISPAAAGMSALFTRSFVVRGKAGRMTYDVGVMGNGALAGLVAITAGCSTIYPWGAVIVGGFAGALYVLGSWVSVKCHLDDPLDAIAVHFWNGTWGVIAVGFLAGEGLIAQSYGADKDGNARQYGCWLGGDGHLLGAQLIYALWLIGWVAGNMIPFWYALKLVGHLRVPANEETVGLDDSYHGGTAYPGGGDDFLDKSGKGGKTMNGNGMDDAHGQQTEVSQLRAEVEALRRQITPAKQV